MYTRKGFRRAWLAVLAIWVAIQTIPLKALSAAAENTEPVVYGTYAALNMGNPGEIDRRDFYINIGSKDGLKVGSKIEVVRKVPTHNLVTQKLQKDMLFPIAVLKVIHVEQNAAVARLDKIVAEENAPAVNPRAVMVGDLVRPAE